MPPTTPPAIAPAGVGVGIGVGVGVGVGVVVVDSDAGGADEVIVGGGVAVVVRVVVAVKGAYVTVTEPPLYVGYTVTTVPAIAQPKYVNSVSGKTKMSYWQ